MSANETLIIIDILLLLYYIKYKKRIYIYIFIATLFYLLVIFL